MYMAVRKSRSSTADRPGQMAFIRIYRGTKTSCSVSSTHLDNAHIDSSASNRPAVVFRIAAKNEQGYGPATQIRWIQGGLASALLAPRSHSGGGCFHLRLLSFLLDPSKLRASGSKAENSADADHDAADR